MSDIEVHPSAKIGPRVSIGGGSVIGPNCVLDGDVRIGESCHLDGHVTVGGDTEIGREARIGAGAGIGPGLRVGPRASIAPESVVVSNVPARGVVRGDPAQLLGFGVQPRLASSFFSADSDARRSAVADCGVGGVQIHRFPRIDDSRGSLSFGEFGRGVPFKPERYFLVYDVQPGEVRGEHAHATCHELLIALGGSIAVAFDDGERVGDVILDDACCALHVPPRTWATQYKHSKGAVLAVFASHYFDESDYMRNYDQFLGEVTPSR